MDREKYSPVVLYRRRDWGVPFDVAADAVDTVLS